MGEAKHPDEVRAAFKKLLEEIEAATKAKLQKPKKKSKSKQQTGIEKKNSDGNRDKQLIGPRPKLVAAKPRG